MSTLAQTALDFCRECLGWSSAVLTTGTVWSCDHGDNRLDPSDLNAVMKAVLTLVDEHPRMTWVRLHFDNTEPGFRCEIETLDSGVIADVSAPDACQALLAACIAASRKLKLTT